MKNLYCNISNVNPVISALIIDVKQWFKPKFSNSIEFNSNLKSRTEFEF
jgi:hypothetical protein